MIKHYNVCWLTGKTTLEFFYYRLLAEHDKAKKTPEANNASGVEGDIYDGLFILIRVVPLEPVDDVL